MDLIESKDPLSSGVRGKKAQLPTRPIQASYAWVHWKGELLFKAMIYWYFYQIWNINLLYSSSSFLASYSDSFPLSSPTSCPPPVSPKYIILKWMTQTYIDLNEQRGGELRVGVERKILFNSFMWIFPCA